MATRARVDMRLAIALKRAARQATPTAWTARLDDIEGVRVISEQHGRIIVDVEDDETRLRLERALGGSCHIEPLVTHQPSNS